MRINGSECYVCPGSSYILRAITDGLYYSLVGSRDFANSFGSSFQNYTGEVLAKSFAPPFEIIAEHRYGPRAAARDSVDWIVEEQEACLFIECKSRRVSLRARTVLQEREQMAGDIDNIATCILQMYKTLSDAVAGRYDTWKPPAAIYPVLVTLEDWYGVGIVRDRIDQRLREKFLEGNHESELLTLYPYTLCSIQELEVAAAAMSSVGIGLFMSDKTSGEEATWLLSTFTQNKYRDRVQDLKALFPEAWEDIHPRLGNRIHGG